MAPTVAAIVGNVPITNHDAVARAKPSDMARIGRSFRASAAAGNAGNTFTSDGHHGRRNEIVWVQEEPSNMGTWLHQPMHAAGGVVKDEKTGETTNWGAEFGPPHGLQRSGWRRDTVKLGEKVTVTDAALAKNGSKRVNARTITLASTGARPGQTLDAASSEGDGQRK